MASYKENIAWKHSFELAKLVYKVTASFPSSQRYGFADQLQRAAVSIPSNIAEGWVRSRKDWLRFMTIAYGSAAEVETQLLLAKELSFISEQDFQRANNHLVHILRILNYFLSKSKPHPKPNPNPNP